MKIEDIRELDSRTFTINADMEKWKVIIDRKVQLTRLTVSRIISDDAIKLLAKYLIESVRFSNIYYHAFRQNAEDNKKFLIKFELNSNRKEITILRLTKNKDNHYMCNRNKNFFYDNSITLLEFIKESENKKKELINLRKARKNENIAVNRNGLKIVKKENK